MSKTPFAAGSRYFQITAYKDGGRDRMTFRIMAGNEALARVKAYQMMERSGLRIMDYFLSASPA